MPPFLLPDVIEHLEQFTGTADDQLVFSGPKGAQLRRSNFTRQWRKALEAAGMTGIHFHDLRHAGNTLFAERRRAPGPYGPDGHDSERAAMIYQHEARGADQLITNAIDAHLQGEQRKDDDDEDGSAGVLVPAG
jgi:integrase